MSEKQYLKYIRSQNLFDFKDKRNNIFLHTVYMLMRTASMFEWHGLPDTIPEKYLEQYIQVNGFACIGKYNDDLYAFYGGLGGEPDVYYNPTKCVVANPALNFTHEYNINEDCIIIRNDPYYMGLIPMFNKYSSMLAENELSLNMASINTRVQSALSAGDDNTKKSAELYLQHLIDGDIGVIGESEFLDNDLKSVPLASTSKTGIIGDLIEYEQYLKASWCNDLGLQANYNMKREALNSSESKIDEDILFPLVDEMLKMRQEGADAVNKMFGTDIAVDLSSSWKDNREEENAVLDSIEGNNSPDTKDVEETEEDIKEGEENE